MVIRLRLVNKSQASDNPTIAITCTENQDEPVIAWRLVQNLGPDSIHPFTYSSELTVNIGDTNGSYTPQLPAPPGSVFLAQRTGSGNELQRTDYTIQPDIIAVRNSIPDAITAYLYRDQRVCAQTRLLQQMQAMFSFSPRIFVGPASIEQKGAISTFVRFTSEPAQIDLRGISSADIVMQGGGQGVPLFFSIENTQ